MKAIPTDEVSIILTKAETRIFINILAKTPSQESSTELVLRLELVDLLRGQL